MRLEFSGGTNVDLKIKDSDLGLLLKKIYRHLSKLPVPCRPQDNPYYLDKLSYPDLVDRLIQYATVMGVEINLEKALACDQHYFNEIHKIYEKNYNGDTNWLNFHEHIHLCEFYSSNNKSSHFAIDYREKSGPLEKPMQFSWFNDSATYVEAGTVYVEWAELGKNPYFYWKNTEPDDFDRIKELAKPWLKLKPKISIALRDIDRMKNVQQQEFETWWKPYSDRWNQHWNLPEWTLKNMFGLIVVGYTDQVEVLKQALKNNQFPARIAMQ